MIFANIDFNIMLSCMYVCKMVHTILVYSMCTCMDMLQAELLADWILKPEA